MAKLRFPGRPGHRFDRISVRFFADDVKNLHDPSLAFLPQFQAGLRAFRDLVGSSDEEGDFEGFSDKEIKASEEKLEELTREEKQTRPKPTEDSHEIPLKTRRSGGRPSLVDKAGFKHKQLSVKLTASKDGAVKVKATTSISKSAHGPKIKPKKYKLDYKHGLQSQGEQSTKPKKTEMDMAKFLLEKAKQANKLQELARQKRLASAGKQATVQRREFVLPKQSSRSSRVIKPNKRFHEEEEILSPTTKKKAKPEGIPESPITSPDKQMSFTSVDNSKKPIFVSPTHSAFQERTKGLLDQPLIVDGKRDRKPSLKLQLSDEDSLLSPDKPHLMSPLAAPKLGTGLFQKSQLFQKSTEKMKFGLGSGRKPGASILQKAKLQLNRAALNKSKAALARSLKAEMKREAKIAEQTIPVEESTTTSLGKKEIKQALMKKFKKRCCVCECRTELTVFHNLLTCTGCKRFYKEAVAQVEAKGTVPFTCRLRKRCKVQKDHHRYMCRYCRFRKCLNKGFPIEGNLGTLFGVTAASEPEEQQELPSPELVQRSRQTFSNIKSPSSSSTDISPLKSPLIKVVKLVQVPVTPEVKEEELSPLKAGEGSEKRRRKRRAFKELLRTKQEKPEVASQETPVTTTPHHVADVCDDDTPPAPVFPVVTGSVEVSPHGPRIKHVCRNAAVALGKPLATFPDKLELRLSALPTKDKVQLWKKETASKAADSESDDERSMTEIIQQSGDNVVVVKKSPAPKSATPIGKKLTGAGGLSLYKRKMRCKKCPGCLAKDCGKCRHCQDMKKYGGPGTIKQACIDKPKFGGPGIWKKACVERRCTNPVIKRSATEAFINVQHRAMAAPQSSSSQISVQREHLSRSVSVPHGTMLPSNEEAPAGQRVHPSRSTSDLPGTSDLELDADSDLEPVIPGSEVAQSSVTGLQTQTGMLIDDNSQPLPAKSSSSYNVGKYVGGNLPVKPVTGVSDNGGQRTDLRSTKVNLRSSMTTTAQGSEVRRLTFGDDGDEAEFRLEKIASKKGTGKMPTKLAKNLELNQKYTRKEGGDDGQCYPVSLMSVNPASRQWGSLLSQPRYYPIRVDYKSSCDINNCWRYGVALTMSTAMSVRTLCFLCGSAGKHDMVYCTICCEPYHEFCLEDWEQPSPDHIEDWICAACQFCHVCGRQNNLLQCDKCQNTYHPGCLGPNYPTRPSKRKRIWICTKCVKCKSCGATTPGSGALATWTYDFSLCYECGQLMDKGNFCPICKKCYSDDDWESKMIQCNMCQSWVHSKCEGLTDEMYEILSYLPEDLSFYCRKCFPVGCPEWESTLKRELRHGLESILQALIVAKSAKYILKQEKERPLPDNTSKVPEDQTTPEVPSNESSPSDRSRLNGVRKQLAIADSISPRSRCNSANVTENSVTTRQHNSVEGESRDGIVSEQSTCDKPTVLENGDITSASCERCACNGCSNSSKQHYHTEERKQHCCDCSVLRNQACDCSHYSNRQIGGGDEPNHGDGNNATLNHGGGNDTDTLKHNCDTTNKTVEKRKCCCVQENCTAHCDRNCGNAERDTICTGHQLTHCSHKCHFRGDSNSIPNGDIDKDDGESVCDQESKGHSGTCGNNVNSAGTNCLREASGNSSNSGISCKDNNHRIDSECKQDIMEVDDPSLVTQDDVENESSSVINRTERGLHVTNSNQTAVKQQDGRIIEESIQNANCADKTDSVVACQGVNVVQRSHQVRFADSRDFRQTCDASSASPVKQEAEEDVHPRDLMAIAEKMKSGEYMSVAVFCEDILRVIQDYLDQDEDLKQYRRKAITTARAIFVKQVEHIFPWFNVKTCRHWYSSRSLPVGMLADATLPPSFDHTYAQWLERVAPPRSPQPSPYKKRSATPVKKYIPADDDDFDLGALFDGEDERLCMFCQTFGDQNSNESGRLLYCGQDDWCHVNCALWSAEVYESADGSLLNLVEAFSRGKMLRCDRCQKAGATVGCNTKGCKANYHFMCARRDGCLLQEDKKVFCPDHRLHVDGEVLTSDRFNVLRRVYIETVNVRSIKKRWAKGLHVADISVLMGSCCIESLGRLTDLSDKPKFLQPVDFLATRLYWSTKDARRRVVYTCRVVEVRPEALKSPSVTIKDMRIVHDASHPDYVPLSTLELSSYGINLAPDAQELRASVCDLEDSENPLIDLTTTSGREDLSCIPSCEESMECDLTQSEGNTTQNDTQNSACSIFTNNQNDRSVLKSNGSNGLAVFPSKDGSTVNLTKSSSLTALNEQGSKTKEQEKLSLSWPTMSMRKFSNTPNFSSLSQNTLKLLNIKDPTKYIKPIESAASLVGPNPPVDDDSGSSLLRIATRLNNAAKNTRSRRSSEDAGSPYSSRSPSVERTFSPVTTSLRPFSPIQPIRGMRSQSVDRLGSNSPTISFTVGNPQRAGLQTVNTKLAGVPDRPFSPPFQMQARARSLSVEKESLLAKPVGLSSKVPTSDTAERKDENSGPFMPQTAADSPYAARRGRSVSDPLSMDLRPVGSSSPLFQPVKKVDGHSKNDLQKLSTNNMISDMRTEGNSASDSCAMESVSESCMETSQNDTFITQSEKSEQISYTASADVSNSTTSTVNGLNSTLQQSDEASTSEMLGDTYGESSLPDNCTETEPELDTSQNMEADITETEGEGDTVDECSETIVVMTESGESLSEEEAIKLVQDMLEKRTSSAESPSEACDGEVGDRTDAEDVIEATDADSKQFESGFGNDKEAAVESEDDNAANDRTLLGKPDRKAKEAAIENECNKEVDSDIKQTRKDNMDAKSLGMEIKSNVHCKSDEVVKQSESVSDSHGGTMESSGSKSKEKVYLNMEVGVTKDREVTSKSHQDLLKSENQRECIESEEWSDSENSKPILVKVVKVAEEREIHENQSKTKPGDKTDVVEKDECPEMPFVPVIVEGYFRPAPKHTKVKIVDDTEFGIVRRRSKYASKRAEIDSTSASQTDASANVTDNNPSCTLQKPKEQIAVLTSLDNDDLKTNKTISKDNKAFDLNDEKVKSEITGEDQQSESIEDMTVDKNSKQKVRAELKPSEVEPAHTELETTRSPDTVEKTMLDSAENFEVLAVDPDSCDGSDIVDITDTMAVSDDDDDENDVDDDNRKGAYNSGNDVTKIDGDSSVVKGKDFVDDFESDAREQEPIEVKQKQTESDCRKDLVYDREESMDSDIVVLEDLGAIIKDSRKQSVEVGTETSMGKDSVETMPNSIVDKLDETDGDKNIEVKERLRQKLVVKPFGNSDTVISGASSKEVGSSCKTNSIVSEQLNQSSKRDLVQLDLQDNLPASSKQIMDTDSQSNTELKTKQTTKLAPADSNCHESRKGLQEKPDVSHGQPECTGSVESITEELPVLDPIAKKIKEESLAKSCPGEMGPFKCPKCRRMYRTESSYSIHMENCNFCLSSSDEDSNSLDEIKEKVEPRVTRSKKRTEVDCESMENTDKINAKDIEVILEKIVQDQSLTDHDFKDKQDEDCSSVGVDKVRTSLRRSTVYQRVALEVEDKRLKEEGLQKRGRGRPSLNKTPVVVLEDAVKSGHLLVGKSQFYGKKAESAEPEDDKQANKAEVLMSKRGRGRPRKSDQFGSHDATDKPEEAINENDEHKDNGDENDDDDEAITRRVTRSRTHESVHAADAHSETSDVDRETEVTRLAEMVNRKRSIGRLSRSVSIETDNEQELKSPSPKRKVLDKSGMSDGDDGEDVDVGLDNKTSEAGKESVVVQKRRGRKKKRGRKPGWRKNKNNNIDEGDSEIVVDDDSNDEGEVLDPATGLVLNKKTGDVVRDPANDAPSQPTEDMTPKNAGTEDEKKASIPQTENTRSDLGKIERKASMDQSANISCDFSTSNDQRQPLNNENATHGDSLKNKPLNSHVADPPREKGYVSDFDFGETVEEPMEINDDNEEEPLESNKSKTEIENKSNTTGLQMKSDGHKAHDIHVDLTVEPIKSAEEECKQTNSIDKKETCELKDSASVNPKSSLNTNSAAVNDSLQDNQKSKPNEPKPSDVIDLSSEDESEATAACQKEADTTMSSSLHSNLPEAVLKLLKEGHKVVIRNPKLNKNFIWEKTANGYVGKPFEKQLPLKPLASKIKSPDKTLSPSLVNVAASSNMSGNKNLTETDKGILGNTENVQAEREQNKESGFNVLKKKLAAVQQQDYQKVKSASEILFRKSKDLMQGVANSGPDLPHTVGNASTCSNNVSQPVISTPTQQVVPMETGHHKDTSSILESSPTHVIINKIKNLIQNADKNKEKPIGQSSGPAAEYLGGLVISSQGTHTLDQYKNSIESTMPVATYALQNSIQFQNPGQVNPVLQGAQTGLISPVLQGSVQSMVTGVLSPPQIQYSMAQSHAQQIASLGQFSPTGIAANVVPAGFSVVSPPAAQPINQPTSQIIPQFVASQPTIQTQTVYNQAQIQQQLLQQHQQASAVNLQTITPAPQLQPVMPVQIQTQQIQMPNGQNQLVQIRQTSPGRYQAYFAGTAFQQLIASPQYQFGSMPVSIVSSSPQQLISPQVSASQPLPQFQQRTVPSVTQQQQGNSQSLLCPGYAVTHAIPSVVKDFQKQEQAQGMKTGSDQATGISPRKSPRAASKMSPLKRALLLKDLSTPGYHSYIKPGLGGGSAKLYEKMKQLLTKRNKVSSRKAYMEKKWPTICAKGVMKQEKRYDAQGNVIPTAPNLIFSLEKENKEALPKSKTPKKRKWARKTPRKKQKDTNEKGFKGVKLLQHLQQPHALAVKKSHPIIHGQKEVTSLPAAAMEEEVRDIPLSALEEERGPMGDLMATQNLGHLEFEITSDDGFSCRADTIDGAWKQVTEKVQDARTASRLKHLSYSGLSGVQMFGLSHPTVMYLIEQLYGANYCRRYKFKYHKHELLEREIELLNPTGCLRTEPFSGRNPWDMFSFLMSRYRVIPTVSDASADVEMTQKSSRRATSMDLPMAMRFRKLKYYSKECVGVYRSTIHGRGLFCKRSIEAGEMIIEYAGEVIRNALTDLREKYYESKGIGCYMFRIDENDVVDATMKGSAARFINHSCDPNCYSKVITVDNRKHIVIFALRKILRGEELTYDYKFPIEEVKIPCTCGSKKCRKYLN